MTQSPVSIKLLQIHMQNTFALKHYNELTREERWKALESILFLEQKKSEKIKGRMCMDGSKQRDDFAKGEATSPMVIMDSVIITSAIDAFCGN